MENEEIKVVYCKSGKKAVVKNIELSLKSLQEAVGGWIETFYPFEEKVCLIVNEEGKFNGMLPNRAVYVDGEMIDIIFGPFLICDCSGEDFGSLSDEQIKRYAEMFRLPEKVYSHNGKLLAIPFDPDESGE